MVAKNIFVAKQQQSFIQRLGGIAKRIQQINNEAEELINFYWANNLNSGGANEITDDSMISTQYDGIEAAQVVSAVSVLERFNGMMTESGKDKLKTLMRIMTLDEHRI